MIKPFDEGRRVENNIPLSVQCLLMSGEAPQKEWATPHYHEYIELLYPIKGDYQVNLNGEIFEMPENSMFVINSGEPHATFAVSAERSLFCVKFMPQVLYSSEQTVTELEQTVPYVFENYGQRRLFSKELLSTTAVPETFRNIVAENSEKRFGYELAIRSGVLRVFSWIIRYWHENGAGSLPEVNSNTAAVLAKVKNYVNENLTEVTLMSAAEKCGLSYSYLSRLFKKTSRMSFSDYVNLTRVNASMKLLAVTDRNITDIALSCGFSSTSYYIHIFKKMKNISPNKFRKMFR